MRAVVVALDSQSFTPNQIQLVSNHLEPLYVEYSPATKKYRKVGKEARAKLIRFI